MSLYLVEMKIKTALELVQNIDDWNCRDRPLVPRERAVVDSADWSRIMIDEITTRLHGVLREIINRPKEEGNDNG